MKLKAGVRLLGIRPELVLGLQIMNSIYEKNGQEMTVTSLVDSIHGRNSLHFAGTAADLRTRNLTTEIQNKILEEGREALGADFDLILESNHFHIEFQPKKGVNQ